MVHTHQGQSLAKGRPLRNAARTAVLLAAAVTMCVEAGRSQNAPPDPDAIVIRIGPVAQKLQEFSTHFHSLAGADPSISLDRAGIEQVLDSRLEEILATVSVMGDSTVLNRMDVYMTSLGIDQVLQRALVDKLLPQYLKADEEVVRAVYERMATQLKLEAIRVPTLVELDSVQAALAQGEPFGGVARTWSRDPATASQGGQIGWVDAADFPLETQEVLWSLSVGEVSAPLSEQQFHTVYRLADRRPAPGLGTLEEERAKILRGIQRAELGRVGRQMYEDLMAAYNYRVDMDAAEWLRAFLQKETAAARRTYDPEKDKSFVKLGEPTDPPFWAEAPLKGAEAERPVAFISVDTLSALEVIDELDFKPTLGWPTFESVTDVMDLCGTALYYRVQIHEAMRLGLDRDPEVQRQITERKRMMYWRAYRREKLIPALTPTEEELRSLYEQQIGQYSLPERRRFVLVNTTTKELAEAVAALFRKGLVPSSIVRELSGPSTDFEVTPDTTTGWATFGRNPHIDPVLFRLSEGEVSDPIPDRGRYSVVRLERISPAHTIAFESAREGLSQRVLQERERKRIAELAGAAKSRTDVWVDRNAIMGMEINVESIQQRRAKRKEF